MRPSEDHEARRCPLCGEDNACGLAASRGDPCWCVGERIPREVLDRVPAEHRGRTCICRRCIASPGPADREPG
ncbi:MAG TPA: cysteine-rich CWC family protein [Thermodesulfobacteriota bacterium]